MGVVCMSSRHTTTDRPPDDKPEPLSRQCLLVLAVVVLFCVSVEIEHYFVVQGVLDWYYLVLDCVFDKEYMNREEREHCNECDCKTTLNEKLCSQHRLCQNIWPLGGWMSAPFNTGGVLYLLRYLPAIVILLTVGGCCYMYMEDRRKASDRSQASGRRQAGRRRGRESLAPGTILHCHTKITVMTVMKVKKQEEDKVLLPPYRNYLYDKSREMR